MKKYLCMLAAAFAMGMLSGCGAVDTLKNYNWSDWWSIHKEPITELAKDAVSNAAVEQNNAIQTETESAK